VYYSFLRHALVARSKRQRCKKIGIKGKENGARKDDKVRAEVVMVAGCKKRMGWLGKIRAWILKSTSQLPVESPMNMDQNTRVRPTLSMPATRRSFMEELKMLDVGDHQNGCLRATTA
jgi:hypothetical protein